MLSKRRSHGLLHVSHGERTRSHDKLHHPGRDGAVCTLFGVQRSGHARLDAAILRIARRSLLGTG